MSARGRPLTQARVKEWVSPEKGGADGIVVLCGRFEGVDERVLAGRGLEEVSVGDYILSVEVPLTKVLFYCGLLPGALQGEDEFLVIGGVSSVVLSTF